MEITAIIQLIFGALLGIAGSIVAQKYIEKYTMTPMVDLRRIMRSGKSITVNP
jgi:hypothetical protein